jgi:ketosteroid isomerase-like protein
MVECVPLHAAVTKSPTGRLVVHRPSAHCWATASPAQLVRLSHRVAAMAGKRPFRAVPSRQAAMPTDNLALVQDGYAAFAAGDLVRLGELFADDIVWHMPGGNPLSGDYRGKQEVFALFGTLADQTAGTFRAEVHDLLANDTHRVGHCHRYPRRWQPHNQVNVLHLSDGKVTEGWMASTDQQAEDEFWA